MKQFLLRSLFLFIPIITGGSIVSMAQDPADTDQSDQIRRPADRRNVLRELGLTPEQFEQMKALNADVRPRRQAARAKLIEATGELDRAIYADDVDESAVAIKLKNYQDAQAEIAKVNFDNEFAVRKILTKEQLVRFREIRSRFGRQVDNFRRRRDQRMRSRPRGEPGMEPDRMPVKVKPANNTKPYHRS